MLREHAVFPDQLTDCCDAARFFIKHADQYHVDPRNIFAAGSSAGGYAAIMMASETERWKDAPELASLHVDLGGRRIVFRCPGHRLDRGVRGPQSR